MKKWTSNKSTLAKNVSLISIAVNLLLSLGKFAAGAWGHSAAMIADAAHSASDVLSTLIVLFALRISSKQADAEHRYGHERFESLASILLAFMLGGTGLILGYTSIQNIATASGSQAPVPGTLPLIAAIVSIIVKEAMFQCTRRAGAICRSDALVADAWHHRSDALSSIGSFVGILGARLGLPIMDPLAGIAICMFIVKAAADIFISAAGKLTDRSCDAEFEGAVTEIICGVPGVMHLDLLRTRQFGAKNYVDVEIAVDATLSLTEAHEIAENVHREIETRACDVKHCMVHVNPYPSDPS